MKKKGKNIKLCGSRVRQVSIGYHKVEAQNCLFIIIPVKPSIDDSLNDRYY